MIKYLFSNVDKVNGFNEQQIKYLSKDLKTCKSILFVPGDYDKEKYIIYKDKIIGWFENIDIIFKEKHLASLDGELKCYDAIFLMGGNPINQIEIISNCSRKCTGIKKCKIIDEEEVAKVYNLEKFNVIECSNNKKIVANKNNKVNSDICELVIE